MRNGKCYIGSSKNISKRKYEHFRLLQSGKHQNAYLQRAYDLESDKSVFVFHVFIFCKENDLIALEQSCFNTMKPEYNLSSIAGKVEFTKEIKNKISEKNKIKSIGNTNKKGKKLKESSVKKLKENADAYWASDNARRKQSELKKCFYKNNPRAIENHKLKLIKLYKDNPNLAKNHSDLMKNKWSSSEYRMKMILRDWHNSVKYYPYWGA